MGVTLDTLVSPGTPNLADFAVMVRRIVLALWRVGLWGVLGRLVSLGAGECTCGGTFIPY